MTPAKDAGSASAGTNRLMFGDNLSLLGKRNIFPDESVDLIYLDPPFNSNATYNMLFREESGEISRAQFHAFTDTWQWVDAEPTYREFLKTCKLATVVTTVESLHATLKTSAMMAYVAMMAPRLVELHRILKPTGSIYLHCDPTASHYLRILMDAMFGAKNFQNEIVWKRTNARSTPNWPRLHDVLLFYSKTVDFYFQPIKVAAEVSKLPHTLITVSGGKKYQTYELTAPGMTKRGDSGKPWRGFDPSKMGRHWANSIATMEEWDAQGLIHWPKGGGFPRRRDALPFDPASRMITMGDVWTDIDRINQTAKERLGYPTQKPEALLERIVKASSREGDAVLDPFCGCGTTIAVAQRLKRIWIGIDITYLAINLIKRRLDWAFGKGAVSFVEKGQPVDLAGAKRLAELDRFQFQQWALNLVGALPMKAEGGKGADRGVDGLLLFHEAKDRRERILVQVKSGTVKRDDIGIVKQ